MFSLNRISLLNNNVLIFNKSLHFYLQGWVGVTSSAAILDGEVDEEDYTFETPELFV